MPTIKDLAPQTPAGMEHKAAVASPESGLLEADDATGVVEAIVSVTGVLDEDRDIIKPGAYAKSLTKRRPKGIFVHDWGRWVARTEQVEELMPGDSRLPTKTRDGRPWPTQAGGLYVKTRFNLDTTEGKDAYSNVKFFSETGECEWSIGYKVPPGKSVRTKSGERHIEEVDLYEYSPVLFGAAPLSGTLSVKTVATEEGELDEGTVAELNKAAEDVLEEDLRDEVGTEEEVADSAPDGEKVIEGKAALDTGGINRDEQMSSDADLRTYSSGTRGSTDMTGNTRSFTNALDQEVRIMLTEDGMYRVKVNGRTVTGPNGREDLTAEEAEDALLKNLAGDLLLPVQPTPGDTVTWRGATAHVEKVDSDERAGVHATVRFPGSETRRIPAGQLSRPRKLAKGLDDDDVEDKRMGTGLDRSPGKNWVEMTGRLPAYVEEIAKSIHEKRGLPLEQAIPIAIAQIKKWAAGGGDVSAETRARAAKALAQWEALKAENSARQKDAEPDELESTSYPFLPGTYEELREQLRDAATKALSALSAGVTHVEVMGTWPDSAVVTAYHADSAAKSYEFGYALSLGDDDLPCEIDLNEPVPVELKVSVDGHEEDSEGLLPYPSVIDDVALDLKVLLGHSETKAGRVLSAVNEKRLLAAVESLVAVLRAAGLEVDASARTKQEEEEEEREQQVQASQYQDSTAPAAQVTKAVLDPSLLARAYRLLSDEV